MGTEVLRSIGDTWTEHGHRMVDTIAMPFALYAGPRRKNVAVRLSSAPNFLTKLF